MGRPPARPLPPKALPQSGPEPAMIIVASHLPPIRCTVINISEEGAGLWVGSTFGIPDGFDLLIDGDATRRRCRAVWRETHKLGVHFK